MDCTAIGFDSHGDVAPTNGAHPQSLGGRTTAAPMNDHSDVVAVSPALLVQRIMQLAMRCAEAPLDRPDSTIASVIAELGGVLSLVRCIAYLPHQQTLAPHRRYAWYREDRATPPAGFDAATALPWLTSKLRAGAPV